MKKLLIIALTLCFTTINAVAQDYETPKDEIAVSVGYFTLPQVALSFGDAFGSAISGDNASETSLGAWGVTYLHNLNKRLAVGCSVTYEYIYKNCATGKKEKENFLAVIPTVRTYWFRHKSFGMYSRIAAGIAFDIYDAPENGSNESKSHCDALFAFHAAPVAFEAGSNKVAGFLELGYGYQGIVNLGVKFGL